MSHFTVGLIVKNKEGIDDALSPYSGNNYDYFERVPEISREDYIRNFREGNPDTELSDDDIWTMAEEDYGESYVDKDMAYVAYNPDARYDWYEIGGRWPNMLRVKKNNKNIICGGHYGNTNEAVGKGRYRYVDGARIKDIDWITMNKADNTKIMKMSAFWDGYVMGKNPDEDYGFCYKPEYYKEMYKDKEDYIMKSSLFYTHDLLLCPEDDYSEWISMGEMGWFGLDASTEESLNEYLDRFYKIIHDPQYQDYWFVVVDCHI